MLLTPEANEETPEGDSSPPRNRTRANRFSAETRRIAAAGAVSAGIGVSSGWFDEVEVMGDGEGAIVPFHPTRASMCKVSGNALTEATARELATFTIEAFDENGKPQSHGGDTFVVAIRGRGERVRAKVIDNLDGRYAVGFKPITSGKYIISISHSGEPLPGSPFLCHVSTRTPSAPQCVVRGKALLRATARKEETFEIEFRDALGQIAHAEDLDVFVETCDADALRGGGSASGSGPLSPDGSPAGDAPEYAAPAGQRAGRHAGAEGSARGQLGGEQFGGGSASPPTSRPAGLDGLVPLVGVGECLVTSRKPLVVRSGLDLDSEKLGQLYPGQRLTLLDVVNGVEDNGEPSVRGAHTF